MRKPNNANIPLKKMEHSLHVTVVNDILVWVLYLPSFSAVMSTSSQYIAVFTFLLMYTMVKLKLNILGLPLFSISSRVTFDEHCL